MASTVAAHGVPGTHARARSGMWPVRVAFGSSAMATVAVLGLAFYWVAAVIVGTSRSAALPWFYAVLGLCLATAAVSAVSAAVSARRVTGTG